MAKSYTLHKIQDVEIHEGGWFKPYSPSKAVLADCYCGYDPEKIAVQALQILGRNHGSVELGELDSHGLTSRIIEVEIINGHARNIYDRVYKDGQMVWQKR